VNCVGVGTVRKRRAALSRQGHLHGVAQPRPRNSGGDSTRRPRRADEPARRRGCVSVKRLERDRTLGTGPRGTRPGVMTRYREQLNAACRVACRASDPAQKERDAMHCGPIRLASPPSPPSLPPREFREANEDSKRTEPDDPGPANSRMGATATCRSVRATKVARLRLVPADRTSANLACLPATGEVRLTVLAEPADRDRRKEEGSKQERQAPATRTSNRRR
jgi:hypothetical protein